MGRARKFSKKIYCGNCGGWVLTLELETREGSHANKLELTYNHEECGTPGTSVRTYGYHDIYPEKLYQKRHEFTVSDANQPQTVPVLAENAPLEPK